MSKILYFIFFLFLSTISLAQIKVYENAKGNRISEDDFCKRMRNSNYGTAYKVKTDTLILFEYKGKRSFKGKLSSKDLEEITNRYEFGQDNLPMIFIYFPGFEDCNRYFVNEQDKTISRHKRYQVGFYNTGGNVINLYRQLDGLDKIAEALNWKLDEGKVIESLFFPIHLPCESYVIVNKNGEYSGYRGEFLSSRLIMDFTKLAKP